MRPPHPPCRLPCRRSTLATAAVLWLLALAASAGAADALRLPRVFSDGMVVQREMPVRVWGWAPAGSAVTVLLAGRSGATTTDTCGRWALALPALASGPASELVVTAGGETRVIRDVLVGEVFLCSGQSNMAMSLGACRRAMGIDAAIDRTALPEVRFFQAPNATFAAQPQEDVAGSWEAVHPAVNARLSAVAFAFAVELHRQLQVPIGILRASHGGGAAEIKMPLAALRSVSCGRRFHDNVLQRAAPAVDGGYPCSDWNGVIAPLIRYTMGGVVWYQGEHNAGRAADYRTILTALIQGWRDASGHGDLPFVIVQLPAYASPAPLDDWPLLRAAQAEVACSVPGTALVVTIDHGERDQIHPADKLAIGQRAATAMRRLCFDSEESVAPVQPERVTSEGPHLEIHFPAGAAMRGEDGQELAGFAIAGADQRFHPARATWRNGAVVVAHPAVPRPVSVRYAWEGFPAVSLFDRDGLPVGPFRGDAWDCGTGPTTARSPCLGVTMPDQDTAPRNGAASPPPGVPSPLRTPPP